MDEGGRFRRRLVAGLVIAAIVIFGWSYLRMHGVFGDTHRCEANRTVERDANGKVVKITTRACAH